MFHLGAEPPNAARQLVGKRHDDCVLVRPLQQTRQPRSDRRSARGKRRQCGPGAMNQQFAKILVAAFADARPSGSAACRPLPWYQAKPGGKVSPPGERHRVANRSNQGSCVHTPMPGMVAKRRAVSSVLASAANSSSNCSYGGPVRAIQPACPRAMTVSSGSTTTPRCSRFYTHASARLVSLLLHGMKFHSEPGAQSADLGAHRSRMLANSSGKGRRGTVPMTQAMVFSADDDCDVGEDSGAPVSPDYSSRGDAFNERSRACRSRLVKRPIAWITSSRRRKLSAPWHGSSQSGTVIDAAASWMPSRSILVPIEEDQ
jgi:hypothetical protein